MRLTRLQRMVEHVKLCKNFGPLNVTGSAVHVMSIGPVVVVAKGAAV